jgi:hypothetical protein
MYMSIRPTEGALNAMVMQLALREQSEEMHSQRKALSSRSSERRAKHQDMAEALGEASKKSKLAREYDIAAGRRRCFRKRRLKDKAEGARHGAEVLRANAEALELGAQRAADAQRQALDRMKEALDFTNAVKRDVDKFQTEQAEAAPRLQG